MDDSDEDVAQKVTKTQKKKEERKITETKPAKVKVQVTEGDDFVVNEKQAKPDGQRGGRGGRGGDRPGTGFHGQADRGNRGGGRGQNRPGTGFKPKRTDAEGNYIGDKPRGDKKFHGKPREDAHPKDREDGTGKARRQYNKRDGEGRERGNREYKKKTDPENPDAPVEEKPVEEEKKVEEPKTITKTEVIGISIDEFLGGGKKLSAA
jgi:hypothetical protein